MSQHDEYLISTAQERDVDDPAWMSLEHRAVSTEARTKIREIFKRKWNNFKNKIHKNDTE